VVRGGHWNNNRQAGKARKFSFLLLILILILILLLILGESVKRTGRS
jgi:hypothetical protein